LFPKIIGTWSKEIYVYGFNDIIKNELKWIIDNNEISFMLFIVAKNYTWRNHRWNWLLHINSQENYSKEAFRKSYMWRIYSWISYHLICFTFIDIILNNKKVNKYKLGRLLTSITNSLKRSTVISSCVIRMCMKFNEYKTCQYNVNNEW
jgi:hypothetical protein